MDFLNRMARVVDYIEAHLSDTPGMQEIARIACCSAYQFGRVFSYVTGMTLGEYIRKRRLSLAALSIAQGTKIIDAALDAGYASPEAFSRAFRELHGVSPREAALPGAVLQMTPRLSFHIILQGGTDMQYKIMERSAIQGVGIVRTIGSFRPNTAAEDWHDQMGEVWQVWSDFLNGSANAALQPIYRAPLWQFAMTETAPDGSITLMIGAEDDGQEHPGLTQFSIPAATWAVFTAKGTLAGAAHPADALLTRILTDWLPSSGYRQADERMIEVYGPGDAASKDYVTEIWIPIVPQS